MVLTESGLEAFYRDGKGADEEKLANLYELVTAAQRFDAEYGEDQASPLKRLLDYLESVSLVADIDSLEEGDGAGAVTLMTLHAAKGLEFDSVAIVGLEEGLLPHSRAYESPAQLEEERRLCFVGITRAQAHLQMSHARYRTIRGVHQRTVPSPFLSEIGGEAVEFVDHAGESIGGWDADAYSDDDAVAAAASQLGFEKGSIVRHPQFGLGRVLGMIPPHAPKRARVQFERAGVKTLILEYARLEPVDEFGVF